MSCVAQHHPPSTINQVKEAQLSSNHIHFSCGINQNEETQLVLHICPFSGMNQEEESQPVLKSHLSLCDMNHEEKTQLVLERGSPPKNKLCVARIIREPCNYCPDHARWI